MNICKNSNIRIKSFYKSYKSDIFKSQRLKALAFFITSIFNMCINLGKAKIEFLFYICFYMFIV